MFHEEEIEVQDEQFNAFGDEQARQYQEWVERENSYLGVEDAFNRFQLLAKKLARQKAKSWSGDYSDNLEELEQLASVGLLQAIRKHGVDVPAQKVIDFIRVEFRNHLEKEIQAHPWQRTMCPECGSTEARECVHKTRLRKSGADTLKPFEQVNLGWTHGEDADGSDTTYEEIIGDPSDSFATEREELLEQRKKLAAQAIPKLPEGYRLIVHMRSVLWNDGTPATWPEIAEATGLARSTVIRRYQSAMVWLQGIVKDAKPRYSNGKTPRLCSMFPKYSRGQRIPWSQDPKFSLSVVPYFRSAAGYEILEAERAELYPSPERVEEILRADENVFGVPEWGRPTSTGSPKAVTNISGYMGHWEKARPKPLPPVAGSNTRTLEPDREENALFQGRAA